MDDSIGLEWAHPASAVRTRSLTAISPTMSRRTTTEKTVRQRVSNSESKVKARDINLPTSLEPVWTESTENLVAMFQEKCAKRILLHREAAQYYSRKLYLFSVPGGILGALGSSAVFATWQSDLCEETWHRYTLLGSGICMLLSTALGALVSKSEYPAKYAAHLKSYRNYDSLLKKLTVEMSFERSWRRPVREFVDEMIQDYDRFTDESELTPISVEKKIKKMLDEIYDKQPDICQEEDVEETLSELSSADQNGYVVVDVNKLNDIARRETNHRANPFFEKMNPFERACHDAIPFSTLIEMGSQNRLSSSLDLNGKSFSTDSSEWRMNPKASSNLKISHSSPRKHLKRTSESKYLSNGGSGSDSIRSGMMHAEHEGFLTDTVTIVPKLPTEPLTNSTQIDSSENIQPDRRRSV